MERNVDLFKLTHASLFFCHGMDGFILTQYPRQQLYVGDCDGIIGNFNFKLGQVFLDRSMMSKDRIRDKS